MIGIQKHSNQFGMFNSLSDQLNQKHPLYILSHSINWQLFEDTFKPLYSEKMGAPSKPIRLMVSLLILKQVRNLSDENLVEQWSENVYYQYFGGEQFYRPSAPCSSTELVAFRKRIGEAGATLILQESIAINRIDEEDNFGKTISVDTTVQEKNITYPTDDKLYKKIIANCISIAQMEKISLHQTYAKELKKLSILQRFKKRKNGYKIAKKASKRVKTISGRIVRDLERKLTPAAVFMYSCDIELYKKVLHQKRNDSNKIYSLHEPNVKCYAKGKEHKKFEFGSKASIAICQQTGIVVGAVNFTETLHDSKTIPIVLEQIKQLTNITPEEAFADRGYVGKTAYQQTKIFTPKTNPSISTTQRKKHSKRAAIEPIIGHIKFDHRMNRNFLKGVIGDSLNVLLAAAAFNFKRVINLWKKEANYSWQLIYNLVVNIYWNIYAQKFKSTF
jgi:transposase, IS5 family